MNQKGLTHKSNTSRPKATRLQIQPKLMINKPGDRYEREADAMADRVMRMNVPGAVKSSGLVSNSLQRKCAGCEESEKKKKVMRKETGGGGGYAASPALVSKLNNAKAGGNPLPTATKNFMEHAFSVDFSNVRIHTDAGAGEMSNAIAAKGFTFGRDIYLHKHYADISSNSGRRLLAHELTHVVQQRKGIEGAPNTNFKGLTVSQAEPSIARSLDDWLSGSGDVKSMSYTQLLDDIDEIRQWLDNQIGSSPESDKLMNALTQLENEEKSRTKTKPRRKSEKNRDDTNTSIPLPRILSEGTSQQYEDPDELRGELDLIMQWLKRKDLRKSDRQILQTELQNMTPLLKEERERKKEERQAVKVQQALNVAVRGSDETQFVASLRLIESIKPVPAVPGKQLLMNGNESILITDGEVQKLLTETIKALSRAATGIQIVRDSAFDKWAYQSEIEREEVFASWAVNMFRDYDSNEILDRINPYLENADINLSRFKKAMRSGSLVAMGETISKAEQNARTAQNIVGTWINGSIETAGGIVVFLETTRDAASTVNTVLAAIATGGTSAGAAALISAGTSIASDTAQQAMEVKLGLRDKIDWGQFGVNVIVGLITSKIGGSAGKKLTALFAKKLGKAGARIATNAMIGRGSAAFQLAANTLYERLSKSKQITFDEFLQQLSDQLLDPKGIFLDIVLGEIGHRSESRAKNPSAETETMTKESGAVVEQNSVQPTTPEITPEKLEGQTPAKSLTAPGQSIGGMRINEVPTSSWPAVGRTPPGSKLEKTFIPAQKGLGEALIKTERRQEINVDVAAQEHRQKTAYREGSGYRVESAHMVPTVAVRRLLNYSRDQALTVLLPRASHRAFDSHWMAWARIRAQRLRRQGRPQVVTVAEWEAALNRALDSVPELRGKTADTLSFMIRTEFYSTLDLKSSDLLPLPSFD